MPIYGSARQLVVSTSTRIARREPSVQSTMLSLSVALKPPTSPGTPSLFIRDAENPTMTSQIRSTHKHPPAWMLIISPNPKRKQSGTLKPMAWPASAPSPRPVCSCTQPDEIKLQDTPNPANTEPRPVSRILTVRPHHQAAYEACKPSASPSGQPGLDHLHPLPPGSLNTASYARGTRPCRSLCRHVEHVKSHGATMVPAQSQH